MYKGIDLWNCSYIQHYGVKGMKWGIRKAKEKLGKLIRLKKKNLYQGTTKPSPVDFRSKIGHPMESTGDKKLDAYIKRKYEEKTDPNGDYAELVDIPFYSDTPKLIKKGTVLSNTYLEDGDAWRTYEEMVGIRGVHRVGFLVQVVVQDKHSHYNCLS